MNKQQKILLIAMLLAVAVGLHLWHYDYGTRTTKLPPRPEKLELISWSYIRDPWGLEPAVIVDSEVFFSGDEVRWTFYIEDARSDTALLWGAAAPVAVLCVGAFLLLGWRKKQ